MFRGVVGKNTVKKLVRRDERSPLSQLIQFVRHTRRDTAGERTEREKRKMKKKRLYPLGHIAKEPGQKLSTAA